MFIVSIKLTQSLRYGVNHDGQVLTGQLTKQLIQDLDCSIALNKSFVLALNYEIRDTAIKVE